MTGPWNSWKSIRAIRFLGWWKPAGENSLWKLVWSSVTRWNAVLKRVELRRLQSRIHNEQCRTKLIPRRLLPSFEIYHTMSLKYVFLILFFSCLLQTACANSDSAKIGEQIRGALVQLWDVVLVGMMKLFSTFCNLNRDWSCFFNANCWFCCHFLLSQSWIRSLVETQSRSAHCVRRFDLLHFARYLVMRLRVGHFQMFECSHWSC